MDKKEPPFDIYRIRLKGGDKFDILEEPYPLPPPSPPKCISFYSEPPKEGKIDSPSTSAPKDTDKPTEDIVIEIEEDSLDDDLTTMETSKADSVPSVSSRPTDKAINKRTIAKTVLVPVTLVRPSCSSQNIPNILYVREKRIYTTESDSPESPNPSESCNFISPSSFLKQFDGPIAIRKYPESLPPLTNERTKSASRKCFKCHKCLKKIKDRKTHENAELKESKVRGRATSREKSLSKAGSHQGPAFQKGFSPVQGDETKSNVFKVPAVPPLPSSSNSVGKRKRMVSNLPFTGDIYIMETLFKKYINHEIPKIAPFEKFMAVIDRHVRVVSDRRAALLQAHGAEFFLNKDTPLPESGCDKNLMMELKKQWRGLARTRRQLDELLELTDTVKSMQDSDRSNTTKEELVISDDSD